VCLRRLRRPGQRWPVHSHRHCTAIGTVLDVRDWIDAVLDVLCGCICASHRRCTAVGVVHDGRQAALLRPTTLVLPSGWCMMYHQAPSLRPHGRCTAIGLVHDVPPNCITAPHRRCTATGTVHDVPPGCIIALPHYARHGDACAMFDHNVSCMVFTMDPGERRFV
jgi:hypothetical protein